MLAERWQCKSTGVNEKDIVDIADVLQDMDCQPEALGADGARRPSRNGSNGEPARWVIVGPWSGRALPSVTKRL